MNNPEQLFVILSFKPIVISSINKALASDYVPII